MVQHKICDPRQHKKRWACKAMFQESSNVRLSEKSKKQVKNNLAIIAAAIVVALHLQTCAM